MKTNFSLLFYMKKPKNYQTGLVPVYIRITVNSKRTEITTGRECDPSTWNTASGRLNGTKKKLSPLTPILIRYKINFMMPIVS